MLIKITMYDYKDFFNTLIFNTKKSYKSQSSRTLEIGQLKIFEPKAFMQIWLVGHVTHV